MTVGEKRIVLESICADCGDCADCCLYNKCEALSEPLPPFGMNDDEVEKLYTFYEKLKGDKIMEEKTITIAVSEYRFLISDQSTLSKLECYAETHEYLSDDVVRALLGVEKPHPVQLESEGD